MKVGIVIPTFNRLGYLRETLRSALGQSHGDLSVLVIDNGSEDGTADFMRTPDDPRVSYIRNPENLGVMGSINRGIRLLDPDISWCTVLCDDDLLDADFVERCLEAAAAGAKDVVDGRRIFIDGEGRVIRAAAPSPIEESAAGYIRSRMMGARETYLTGVFFSRRGFEEIGGYPVLRTGMASDDAFIYALSSRDRLVHRSDATAYVRIHAGAESQACKRMPDIVAALDQFRDYLLKAASNAGTSGSGEFHRLVDRYCAIIASSCWIQNLHGVIDGKEARWRDDVMSLARLAASRRDRFTFRIRFDAWAALRLGLSPEASGIYRSLWKLVIRLYKYMAV